MVAQKKPVLKKPVLQDGSGQDGSGHYTTVVDEPVISFPVIIERVAGIVHLSEYGDENPYEAAFRIIGRAVSEEGDVQMPLKFSFPFAGETIRVTVDTDGS